MYSTKTINQVVLLRMILEWVENCYRISYRTIERTSVTLHYADHQMYIVFARASSDYVRLDAVVSDRWIKVLSKLLTTLLAPRTEPNAEVQSFRIAANKRLWKIFFWFYIYLYFSVTEILSVTFLQVLSVTPPHNVVFRYIWLWNVTGRVQLDVF